MASLFTESTGTTTGAAADEVFADGPLRRGLLFANNSDSDMVVRISDDDASATEGLPVAAGDVINLAGVDAPTGRISVYCADADKAFTAYQW